MYFCDPAFPQSENDEAMKIAGPSAEHELLKKLEGILEVKFNYDAVGGMVKNGTGSAEGKMI